MGVFPVDRAYAEATADRIREVLGDDTLTIVHQPIVDLACGYPVGYEALARFAGEPRQGPDRWFADAHRVGLGVELELLAVHRALATLDAVPPGCHLAVNVSPETILTRRLHDWLVASPAPRRIVLEVTEHARVDDYDALAAALAPLRRRGVRLAIDDTGAGFASLKHVLRLEPDVLKLDRWFAERIECDRGARALAGALAMFALELQITTVAEGIERAGQASVFENLGVTVGQGYLFGRPGPLTPETT